MSKAAGGPSFRGTGVQHSDATFQVLREMLRALKERETKPQELKIYNATGLDNIGVVATRGAR
jgi:hypothetical protein